MKFGEASAHTNRFDNVDVLSLLDPDWLERSQASRLLQMVAEKKCAESMRIEEHDHVDLLVA